MDRRQFKPILEFEHYLINTVGTIISTRRLLYFKKSGIVRLYKEKLLKPKVDEDGRKRISLRKNLRTHDRFVHRLVAIAFIPNIENKKFINHIDGNPGNNCVSNLEWCTHKENMQHANNLRLIKRWCQSIVQTHPNGENVEFKSSREAAKITGISRGSIMHSIKTGKKSKKYNCTFKNLKYELK